MTFGLCNPGYYIGAFFKIRKSMEVREEGMEVQEEAATHYISNLGFIFWLCFFQMGQQPIL